MRLLSYQHDNNITYGALVPGGTLDLGARLGKEFPDLKTVIEKNILEDLPAILEGQTHDHSLEKIRLLPVIPNPDKILCVGLNYESHRLETERPKTAHPSVFARFPDTLLGHQEPAVIPQISTMFDYEGELALIIGKGGRYIKRDQAMLHIAGYACFNDMTVRDWQHHTIQFTPGKNFPGTGALGPYFIPASQLSGIGNLNIETRLNGEIMQRSNTKKLIFDIPTIVEYISSFTPLKPGDIIATGTPGGVGFKRDPKVLMKPGDEIVVEIESIGLLRNTVVAEQGTGHHVSGQTGL